jgi:hypothetical protein
MSSPGKHDRFGKFYHPASILEARAHAGVRHARRYGLLNYMSSFQKFYIPAASLRSACSVGWWLMAGAGLF